jgi:hypothetical protein
MIMSRLEELEQERERCQQALEELHIYEPNEEWYKVRRHELEFSIACIEDCIEDEKDSIRENNNVSTAFLVVLYTMVVVGLGILIFM